MKSKSNDVSITYKNQIYGSISYNMEMRTFEKSTYG